MNLRLSFSDEADYIILFFLFPDNPSQYSNPSVSNSTLFFNFYCSIFIEGLGNDFLNLKLQKYIF